MQTRFLITGLFAFGALGACGGNTGPALNGGTTAVPPTALPPSVAPTVAPPSTQQVVTAALPSSAIGQVSDARFGLVGGYTQNLFSQVLGFVPGARIMIRNGQSSGIPHTLGDTGAASFPAGQPASLSTVASAATTISHGWQSGTIAAGQSVGPFTLAMGTYFIGCAFHYASNNMRDVLVVAANATPGPQATPQAGVPVPNPSTPSGPTY